MCLVGYGRTASVKGALCCTGEVLSHLVKNIRKLYIFMESMTPPPPPAMVRHVRRHAFRVPLQEHPGLAALEGEHDRLARQRP